MSFRNSKLIFMLYSIYGARLIDDTVPYIHVVVELLQSWATFTNISTL